MVLVLAMPSVFLQNGQDSGITTLMLKFSKTQPAVVVEFSASFYTFTLSECSPHFSAMSQIMCTVIALEIL
jgi:hypothetical protein